MKVVIVGSNAIWAIENYYVRYLRELDIDVSLFNCSEYYQHRSFVVRVLNRLGVRAIYRSVNQSLLSYIKKEKPDIIWIFKGVEIFQDTLKQLKQGGAILVNYNPDHPFIRTTISHGGKAIESAVSLYDSHLCYSQSLKQKIEADYKIKCFVLPFGYEPSETHKVETEASRDILSVCMIGYADSKRALYINALLKSGISVDVYGDNWSRYLNESPQCHIYPAVFGDNFWRTLLDYRVQLNVFRPHNEGSHNMRTFEIPSVGGIQLAPYSSEHADYFSDRKEIWLYTSLEDMVDKAQQILALSGEQASQIRMDAKKRSQMEEYTYATRARQVSKIFIELCKNKHLLKGG